MGVSHLPYQYVDINTVQGLKLLCMYSLLHKPILPSLIVHANTAMDGCKSTLYGPPTCFGHLCCHPQGGQTITKSLITKIGLKFRDKKLL